MSGVKHTPVKLHAVFNGHYWDVAVSPENFSQCVGSCHQNAALGYGLDGAERYARLFAAAPDLLAVASQPVVHIVEGDETIVRLMIGKVEVCAFERGDWRATALIMFDAEQRAAIARARGEQSQSEKEVGNG